MQHSTGYRPQIKIFSDGADKKSMLEMAANPVVSGITTNPSLMKKAGVQDYVSYCKEILGLIQDKPISFEVLADEFSEMRRQALEVASWGKNVYVKIPVINSRGESAAELIHDLSHKNVKLNVTAITTVSQSLDACQALKGGAPSIISLFAGRLGDIGHDPVPFVTASVQAAAATDKNIEPLWASTREAYNILQAEQLGCRVITVPPEIIKKVSGFGKTAFQLSVDTVQTFCKDTASAGFKF